LQNETHNSLSYSSNTRRMHFCQEVKKETMMITSNSVVDTYR
jgi:hypothetical protein